MRYVDEFRDGGAAARLVREIAGATTRPWTIMEVCGGQTHAIIRFGIDALLPAEVELVHGPGCPVCVTPVELIDRAIELARRPEVTLCSFGDMLRVPGTRTDLLTVKAGGGDVRIVYSPLDAVRLAEQRPDRQVVFFAVGFETTAPATALAVYRAARRSVPNFSLLVAHVLVPPAMESLLAAPHNRVQGFLAAGHVCTVTGFREYEPLARHHRVPIVVTGFEPLDVLQGVLACIRQLEARRYEVENQYARCVSRDGNPSARRLVDEVFEVASRRWRGLGEIPDSGLRLRAEYAAHNAETRFACDRTFAEESGDAAGECIAGQILQGVKKPHDCPAFGTRCAPEHPLGAPMVSSEGACAAYFRYRSTRTAVDLLSTIPR